MWFRTFLLALSLSLAVIVTSAEAQYVPPIAAVRTPDGRLQIFVTAPDGTIRINEQCYAVCDWTGWWSLGNPGVAFNHRPLAIQDFNTDVIVFTVGTGDRVFSRRESAGGWTGWTEIPGAMRYLIGVQQNIDGRLELFGADTSIHPGFYQVYSRRQVTTGSDSWGDWRSTLAFATTLEGITVTRDGTGRLQIFYNEDPSNGVLSTVKQETPGSFEWEGYPSSLYFTDFPQISAGRNADGRLELFATGYGPRFVHIWQNVVGDDSSWAGGPTWSTLSNYLSQWGLPIVTSEFDGRLAVFGIGYFDPGLHVSSQGCGDWCPWFTFDPFAFLYSSPTAILNADGRMEVFIFRGGSYVAHAQQSSPGVWTDPSLYLMGRPW